MSIGDGLPDDSIEDCYLAGLSTSDLVDMARAAVLLNDIFRTRNIDPSRLPDAAVRTVAALVGARRMRPSTLRKTLEAVGAPAAVYDTFLRLAPGAIAPER